MKVFCGPFIYVKMKLDTVAHFIIILKLIFLARSHYKTLLQIANVLFSEHFYCFILLVPCVFWNKYGVLSNACTIFMCIPFMVQDVHISSEILIFVMRHKRNEWD